MAEQKRASFAVEDMSEGSNLFDNVRATVTGGKFTMEAPENYTADGNPIFAVVNLLIAGDGPVEERTVSQSYSLGAQAGDKFTVSDDGDFLIASEDGAAIRKDCKFGTLASSLQNEGVPKTILGSFGWKAITGLDGQWKRVADKERNFGEDKRTSDKKKSKFPPSTLILVKLYAMPGEKPKDGGTKTTAAATASAPAATSPAGDFDLDTATSDYITAALASKGGPIQRSQLTLLVSKAAMKEPNRQLIARRATDEDFLKQLSELGIVKYDGTAKPQLVSAAV